MYNTHLKRNLFEIKMLANGFKSKSQEITNERIEVMSKMQLVSEKIELDTIVVPSHEVKNVANLTFFQSKNAGGKYQMSVLIAPSSKLLSLVSHREVIALCDDVKQNLFRIKTMIDNLYSEYKRAYKN